MALMEAILLNSSFDNAELDTSVDVLLLPQDNFTDLNSTFNDTRNSTECVYWPTEFLEEKIWLILVLGTFLCFAGFCNNCLLLHVLLRSTLIRTHVFYLAILAACDIAVELAYVLSWSVQIFSEYTHNLPMYRMWNYYVRPVFTITHVAMTIGTYMIVSATTERYVTTSNWMKRSCLPKDRWIMTLVVFAFALVSKGLVFWEIEVIHKPNCTGFEEFEVRLSDLAMDPPYKIGYMLWFRHIMHVFFPFFLLLFLNLAILSRLKKEAAADMNATLLTVTMGDAAKQRRKNVRAATKMLAAVVTTYLISNVLNVVITLWEHVDLYDLKMGRNRFYTFTVDSISILTIFTGAIRLYIYCACNKSLWDEVKRLVRNCGMFVKGNASHWPLRTDVVWKRVSQKRKYDDNQNHRNGAAMMMTSAAVTVTENGEYEKTFRPDNSRIQHAVDFNDIDDIDDEDSV